MEPGLFIIAISAIPRAVMWMGVLVVLVVAMWFAWRTLRRRFLDDDGDDRAAAPWTLQQLRDLKARGEINTTEFEALRAQIIADTRGGDEGGQVIGGYGDSQLDKDIAGDPPGHDSQPPTDDGPGAN